MINGPRVVNRPGFAAAMISSSGLTYSSPTYQNASSSQITAMYVGPRNLRKLAGRTSIEMLLASSMVSAVRPLTNCRRISLSAK